MVEDSGLFTTPSTLISSSTKYPLAHLTFESKHV